MNDYDLHLFSLTKVYLQLTVKNRETGELTYFFLSNKLKHTFVADTQKNTYSLTVQSATVEYYGEEAETTNFYQVEEGTIATAFEPYVLRTYTYTQGQTLGGLNVPSSKSTLYNSNKANMNLVYIKPFDVFNEGLETSKPIMVLKGEGTVGISVNGMPVFEYTFPEGENEVVIDSEKEDAYLGTVLKNRNMNGEFPVLLPGTNIIEWSGNVSGIEILPRSRWL